MSNGGLWTPPSDPASPSSPRDRQNSLQPSQNSPSTRQKYKGRKIAQIVKLKPDCVEKYKECHAKVWPEVLEQIKRCNIEDCELLLLRFRC
jgi:hypothetical protein